jgi:hypothetical protein
MTDLPAQDFAGLARLAFALRSHRRSGGGWDTDGVAAAGIGRVFLVYREDGTDARVVDSIGRTIATVRGDTPDIALTGLMDLLQRLAGDDAAGAVLGGLPA